MMRNLINLAGQLVRGPDDCEHMSLRCEAASALKDAHYEIERLQGCAKLVGFLSRPDIQIGGEKGLEVVVHQRDWRFEGCHENVITAARMAMLQERKLIAAEAAKGK